MHMVREPSTISGRFQWMNVEDILKPVFRKQCLIYFVKPYETPIRITKVIVVLNYFRLHLSSFI